MVTERESMTLNEVGARALGVEERSDETPSERREAAAEPGGGGQTEAAPVHR